MISFFRMLNFPNIVPSNQMPFKSQLWLFDFLIDKPNQEDALETTGKCCSSSFPWDWVREKMVQEQKSVKIESSKPKWMWPSSTLRRYRAPQTLLICILGHLEYFPAIWSWYVVMAWFRLESFLGSNYSWTTSTNRFGAIFSLFLIFCSTKTKTFVVPSNLCRNLANTPEQRLIDLSKD